MSDDARDAVAALYADGSPEVRAAIYRKANLAARRLPVVLVVDARAPREVQVYATTVVDVGTGLTTLDRSAEYPDKASPDELQAATAWAARFGRGAP